MAEGSVPGSVSAGTANLQDSISKLDLAIQNLIALFSKAISELESNTDEMLSKKLDVIIEQNNEINHKLDRLLGPEVENEKLRLATIASQRKITRLKLKRKI